MSSACSSSTSSTSVRVKDIPKCISYMPVGMMSILSSVWMPQTWMPQTQSKSLVDRVLTPQDPELLSIQLKCTVKDGHSVVTLVHEKDDYSEDAFFEFTSAKGNEATVTLTSFLSDDITDENEYHSALAEGTTTLVADSI